MRLSKIKYKLILFTLYFLLLVFFFQTRFSLVRPRAIDYLIPFVYLSDLLLILFIFFTLAFYPREFIFWAKKIFFIFLPWLFFLLLAIVSNMQAKVLFAAWYKWFKIGEFSCFAICLAFFVNTQLLSDQRQLARLFLFLNLGLVLESLLALGEWVLKRSLGLQILGEWRFSILTPGIAKIAFRGEEFLRPYATFPHPNVLGGVLAIFAAVNFYLLMTYLKEKRYRNFSLCTFHFTLFTFVLFLTFSRSAWLSYLLLMPMASFFSLKQTKAKVSYLAVALVAFLILAVFAFPPFRQRFQTLETVDQVSFLRRLELNKIALQMISRYPLFGVGLNNFIPHLMTLQPVSGTGRFLQPVHNLWLLVAAENGLVGLGTLFLFLACLWYHLIRRPVAFAFLRPLVFLFWLGLLLPSFVDHYWWSLQQGQLIVWLTIALSIATIKT